MSSSGQPFPANSSGGGIPLFNKHGTALSASERKKMAVRKGICLQCGTRTHELKGVARRVPLSNDEVYNGICIRCNPSQVPALVFTKWESIMAEQSEMSTDTAVHAATLSPSHLEGSRSGRGLNSSRFQDSYRSYGSNTSLDPDSLIPGGSDSSKQGSSTDLSSGYDRLSIRRKGGSLDNNNSGRDLNSSEDLASNLDHLSLLKKKKSTPKAVPSPNSPQHFNNVDFSLGGHSARGVDLRSQRVLQGKRRSGISTDDFTGGAFAQDDAWAVVKGMRASGADPEALKHYLHRLRNLGDDQVGAMFEIKDVMDGFQNESSLLAVACSAVWGIAATDDDSKVEARESGVLENIVDALHNSRNRGNEDFVQWAVGSLACLSHGDGNRELIAEVGGIDAIFEALTTHMESPEVFEWSCRALHGLVHKNDCDDDDEYTHDAAISIEKNIVKIDQAGGLSKIVEAMNRHPSELGAQGWAIKLLLRLLDRKDSKSTSSMLRKLNRTGAIPACTHVLGTSSATPEAFVYAAALVTSLIPHAKNGEALFQNTSERCFPYVAIMMKTHREDEILHEACCQLLSKLERSSRLHFTESNALIEIVASMGKFASNIVIQETAARILWSMSFVNAFYDSSVTKNAVMALNRSTKEFSDSVPLQCAACGFLANVSLIADTKMSVIPLEIPFRAMRSSGTEEAVADQACRALTIICTKVPEKINRFISGEGVSSFVKHIRAPSPSTIGHTCRALAVIARTSDKNRDALVQLGVINLAVDVLKDPELAPEKRHVMGLLASLVDGSQEEVAKGFSLSPASIGSPKTEATLSADLMSVIMESVLAEEDKDVLAGGCSVLATLLLGLDPALGSPIDMDCIVKRMAYLLKVDTISVGTKKAVCEIVWILATKFTLNASDLQAMFESVVSAMCVHHDKYGSFQSDLQLSASGALGAITDGMREKTIEGNPISNESMDTVVGVMDIFLEHDKYNIELIENILYVIVNLSAIAPAIVTQCGGIVLGIETMRDYVTYEGIQEKGCAMVALLSGTGDLQAKLCITETDGIDAVVGALTSFGSNELIQTATCACLLYLSDDPEARSLIASQGGLMLLGNALQAFRSNVDLTEYAFMAMANLAADSDEQVLSAANVLETVIDVMKRQRGVSLVQKAGLDVLKTLSMRSKDFKRAIAKSGGVRVVISVLKDFVGTPSVLERAFAAMWSLAVLDYNRLSLGRKNGIYHVLNGMLANIDHENVQKQGCGCLRTLAINSDNKAAIRNAGGVDVVVYAMWANYGSEQLQAEACRALSSIVIDLETNEVMLAGEGEINAIISAMRNFPKSERLQGHACAALRNLMLSADNVELIRGNAEELVSLLVIAASSFPNQCAEWTEDIMDCL